MKSWQYSGSLKGFFRLPFSTRQNSSRVRITHRNFNDLNDLVRGIYPTFWVFVKIVVY
ncbi:hypothetical protein [Alysiella crassa]|uniref:hypothetical protein n=1 Tax=Alysiella crassa TaxID=153491 RepID=UPI001FD39C83|nr:hypothetical protein [Alysiella crassa]UOP06625.1 hypothetical protein LVJ80_12915 [Alysiella crassa]